MGSLMLIRPERETDISAIHSLNVSAFETSTEIDLVDLLRQQAHPIISRLRSQMLRRVTKH